MMRMMHMRGRHHESEEEPHCVYVRNAMRRAGSVPLSSDASEHPLLRREVRLKGR